MFDVVSLGQKHVRLITQFRVPFAQILQQLGTSPYGAERSEPPWEF